MADSVSVQVEQTRVRVNEALLDARRDAAHWRGELSPSALATATAVLALHASGREPSLVEAGLRWLVEHQNEDGGWGDTVRSDSNVSTTMLAWSALARGAGGVVDGAVRSAERWLEGHAGSLEPERLAKAIVARYGRDRTFSVPILTVSVLSGRLGSTPTAWRLVPQLPFELAVLPQSWFHRLRLPVVSYALPALIALGLARHRSRPSANPVARAIRNGASAPALALLRRIQPSSGGFLEATPLTSFVVASLVAAGEPSDDVVEKGVSFLTRSARDDGAWPIDTDLATWVTTLSVKALAGAGLDPDRTRAWLLSQQFREVHPYTRAAPGGWAWTDLPGGVPDADDTSGALLALRTLGPPEETTRAAARAGVRWLLDLQNRDGGIPTFCRGWGALPFDRSGTDLTAHALRAWTAWRDDLPELGPRVSNALARGVAYLAKTQRSDGAWTPLWFGNQRAPEEESPAYGTSRVVLSLAVLGEAGLPGVVDMRRRAVEWLLRAQAPDGGWGGDAGVTPSIEETALAVEALARVSRAGSVGIDLTDSLRRGLAWLVDRTDGGRSFPSSPIGLYFAKLWYFEKLYPLSFTAAALNEAALVKHD